MTWAESHTQTQPSFKTSRRQGTGRGDRRDPWSRSSKPFHHSTHPTSPGLSSLAASLAAQVFPVSGGSSTLSLLLEHTKLLASTAANFSGLLTLANLSNADPHPHHQMALDTAVAGKQASTSLSSPVAVHWPKSFSSFKDANAEVALLVVLAAVDLQQSKKTLSSHGSELPITKSRGCERSGTPRP